MQIIKNNFLTYQCRHLSSTVVLQKSSYLILGHPTLLLTNNYFNIARTLCNKIQECAQCSSLAHSQANKSFALCDLSIKTSTTHLILEATFDSKTCASLIRRVFLNPLHLITFTFHFCISKYCVLYTGTKSG